jgi:hypothetical protein
MPGALSLRCQAIIEDEVEHDHEDVQPGGDDDGSY